MEGGSGCPIGIADSGEWRLKRRRGEEEHTYLTLFAKTKCVVYVNSKCNQPHAELQGKHKDCCVNQ